MNIAIIGAGYAGLALAYYLLQDKHQVNLFDSKGIGAGASGVSTGLLHPFPGEKLKKSKHADAAMQETLSLLKVAEETLQKKVFEAEGILRYVHEEELALRIQERQMDGLIWKEGRQFWIPSGVTVFSKRYLEGLAKAVFQKGGKLTICHLESLEELQSFDLIVVAAGAGSLAFFPELKEEVTLIKGQVLIAERKHHLPYSLLGKGSVTKTEEEGIFHLGSTYERGFTSAAPCKATAEEEILTKIKAFYPEVEQYRVIDCKAEVRVAHRGDYLPILRQMAPKTYVVTAMGSRGLLYHAYYAKLFKNSL